MICPVTVVPTLAPIIIPSDWCRVRSPAPTRPEVITIVAVEDWITAVIARPVRNALKELSVSFPRTAFNVPDAPSRRLLPISLIP